MSSNVRWRTDRCVTCVYAVQVQSKTGYTGETGKTGTGTTVIVEPPPAPKTN